MVFTLLIVVKSHSSLTSHLYGATEGNLLCLSKFPFPHLENGSKETSLLGLMLDQRRYILEGPCAPFLPTLDIPAQNSGDPEACRIPSHML